MTNPGRKAPRKRHSRYHRSRGRQQSGDWKREGREWAWTDLLLRGVTSAWLAFWRWVWWLQLRLAIFVTILVVGHWVGWLRVLPTELVVPLRAGIFLYWVLAATFWVMYRLGERQRARDLQVRDIMYTYYVADLGGDLAGFYDAGFDGGGYDGGGFDVDFGGGD